MLKKKKKKRSSVARVYGEKAVTGIRNVQMFPNEGTNKKKNAAFKTICFSSYK